jgi:superfamily II DNA or RNA helicase
MESDYKEFIESKRLSDPATGLATLPELSGTLFPFQSDIVGWALRRGRAAIFADCGMGKTAMQLEWARHVCAATGGAVLVLAPLAVAQQTIREGIKFGITVSYARKQADASATGITITNYEMVEHFDPAAFAGVVLDESSILKSYSGKFRTYLMEKWSPLPWRLCCTATPAPNDYMELGNHCEFLGVMTGSEMLASFFLNDPGNVGRYRLKGHAESSFWQWMANWAVVIRRPSDLGYEDGAFTLPPLAFEDIVVEAAKPADGLLFAVEARTLQERQGARRASIEARVNVVVELVNADREAGRPWLVWCDLNAESSALASAIPDAVEVRGSDSPEEKADRLNGFAEGRYRVLVTKPSIAGFGMNFQHCADMAFTGLSDSYEQLYQAVRRCWRFGQRNPVRARVVTSSTEGAVVENIRRKEALAEALFDGMARQMAHVSRGEVRGDVRFAVTYERGNEIEVPTWLAN